MKSINLILGAVALVAVSLAASPDALAQENGNRDENGKIVRGPYETNRFSDNWFIGVGGGVNILFGTGIEKSKIGPSIDANFGKWFTPSIGMRIGYQGFRSNMLTTNSIPEHYHYTGNDVYLNKLGYMYFHGDLLLNISNAIGGYKETRFWNLVPYLHAGYFRSYTSDDVNFADNEVAMGVGLIHNLRLTDRLDLVIDMRATMMSGRVYANGDPSVLPTVTAGLAVDLGFPNFVRTSTVIGEIEAVNAEKTAILETAMVALEAANEALAADNEALANKNEKLARQVKDLENRPTFDVADFFEKLSPAAVYFDIGKATLDKKQLQQLDFIANNLITTAEKETQILITVMGSADGNTGSAKRNAHLSEARGKYVFDILTTKYGISPERLIVKNEIAEKSDKPELSRAVFFTF